MEINIYQGGNSPIILETPFELNTIKKIEVSLWIFGTKLKHWSTDDIITEDNKFVILPLSETETIGFESGTGKLEIKMLNNQNEVILFEDIAATVLGKSDKTRLTEGI